MMAVIAAANSAVNCSASTRSTSMRPVCCPLRWRKVSRNVLPGS